MLFGKEGRYSVVTCGKAEHIVIDVVRYVSETQSQEKLSSDCFNF